MFPQFVWSEKYTVDMGDHIFPVTKYQRLRDAAIAQGILWEEDFVEPKPASHECLLRVHRTDYLRRLERLALTPEGMVNGENPVSSEILYAATLCCGGTYDACRTALVHRFGMNLGGGFHHAFPDHEEGFCLLNDVAVAIKALQAKGSVQRVMVVDCDVHQGNGTAKIFEGDQDVYTFSIHDEYNYPVKERSDWDIGLIHLERIDDGKYLDALEILPTLLDRFNPELVLYLAGADPYEGDVLGGFLLTKEGLKIRDEYVLGSVWERGIPAAVVLSGGYAESMEDTVEIHLNTVRVVKKLIDRNVGDRIGTSHR